MRRRRTNHDLPRGLYADRKYGRWYYKYKHPHTGTFHGVGTDKRQAIDAALRLNQELGATPPTAHKLVQRVHSGRKTMGDALDRFLLLSKERGVTDNTLRSRNSLCKSLRERFGDLPIADVTTRMLAEFFDEVRATGKQRTAQALRSTAKEIFRDAMAQGWIDRNPAIITEAKKVVVQRERLTLDQFKQILIMAESLDPWVSNSMLLGLITGQRVSDVARMRFKDVQDGFLLVEQKKTGNRVRLSLDLRLDAIDTSLSDVIRRCRDRVVSPYLIHHTKPRTMSKPGEAVHENTVSKGFKRARNLSGIEWEKTPATFHEIRSLSVRLYKEEKRVDPQALLGHKDAATTASYLDNRGAEWITVTAS